jgi:hypothetical protein
MRWPNPLESFTRLTRLGQRNYAARSLIDKKKSAPLFCRGGRVARVLNKEFAAADTAATTDRPQKKRAVDQAARHFVLFTVAASL